MSLCFVSSTRIELNDQLGLKLKHYRGLSAISIGQNESFPLFIFKIEAGKMGQAAVAAVAAYQANVFKWPPRPLKWQLKTSSHCQPGTEGNAALLRCNQNLRDSTVAAATAAAVHTSSTSATSSSSAAAAAAAPSSSS